MNSVVNFIASYQYGEQSEWIRKPSRLAQLFQTLVVMPFKTMIYPAASFLKTRWVDSERIAAGKQALQMIGGQSTKIQTPDGDVIDGMYLDAATFKALVTMYFDVFEETQEDGTVYQELRIRPELCNRITRKNKNTGQEFTYLEPKPEVAAFVRTISKMGGDVRECALLNQETNERGMTITVGRSNQQEAPHHQGTLSQPTVLIAQGSGINYPAYKSLAFEYLLRGMNVMMVDFRGYGESTGSPTSHKTKLDLEAAYQYLSSVKHLQPHDLVVHGHCLGGGRGC